MNRYTTDMVYSVRESAILALSKILSLFEDDFADSTVFPTISDLIHHEKYLFRITGIHMMIVRKTKKE